MYGSNAFILALISLAKQAHFVFKYWAFPSVVNYILKIARRNIQSNCLRNLRWGNSWKCIFDVQFELLKCFYVVVFYECLLMVGLHISQGSDCCIWKKTVIICRCTILSIRTHYNGVLEYLLFAQTATRLFLFFLMVSYHWGALLTLLTLLTLLWIEITIIKYNAAFFRKKN